MTKFFRCTEDAYANINITLLRLSLVAVVFLACKSRHKAKLLKPALILGLCGQILLFSRYVGNNTLFIKEGLPLSRYRISAIMMLVTYILHNDKLIRYFVWMGPIGAIIALTFPDPSKYLWPHVTNLTYVVSHLLLGYYGVTILSTRKGELKLKDSLMITNMVNVGIMTVNLIMHIDYGYLIHLPPTVSVRFTPAVTFLMMSLIIIFTITLTDHTHSKIIHKKQTQPQLTMQQ